MAKHTDFSKILVTGISILIGIGIKGIFVKGWMNTYNEEPPGLKPSDKIEWGKLILWTFFSGLLLRLVKVMVKRSLTIAMKRKGMLT